MSSNATKITAVCGKEKNATISMIVMISRMKATAVRSISEHFFVFSLAFSLVLQNNSSIVFFNL